MKDPELVGEVLHALHILDTPHTHPVMQKGFHFLIDSETISNTKAGRRKSGNWVTSKKASFYKGYHTAYCGIIGLGEFKFTSQQSVPEAQKRQHRNECRVAETDMCAMWAMCTGRFCQHGSNTFGKASTRCWGLISSRERKTSLCCLLVRKQRMTLHKQNSNGLNQKPCFVRGMRKQAACPCDTSNEEGKKSGVRGSGAER
jgi:hypothetical protein